MSANVFGTTSAPTGIDPNVATYDPAQLLQSLLERRDASLRFRIGLGHAHEHADVPHTVGLLCARTEWPCCRCAAEQRHELAPLCMSRKQHIEE
jgi:hypothetical protein